jgi:hypothetical protein
MLKVWHGTVLDTYSVDITTAYQLDSITLILLI